MKMNYFVLGTNNMAAAIQFYDALFALTEYQQSFATQRMTFWQGKDEDTAFAVALPFDEKTATHGNGTMVGFELNSIAEVKELYHKAIELGGANEGEPNQRGPRYSAYVRDLDSNKIVFSYAL